MSLEPSRVHAIADAIELSYERGEPIAAPPSATEPGFDLAAAYQIEAELTGRRRAAGQRTVGLKVGFANKAMWRILKLDTLVWAHMYERTVHMAPSGTALLSIAGRVSPRIEPEIVFKLARPVEPGLTDPEAILACVEWMALGLEINDCVFPDWKFQPADFVAAYGFHTALIVGPPHAPGPGDAAMLASLTLQLSKDGAVVEEGAGKNALRSPALCLGELASALARQSVTPPLAAGELVSTGTLTTPVAIEKKSEVRSQKAEATSDAMKTEVTVEVTTADVTKAGDQRRKPAAWTTLDVDFT
jgi:2-oxo-3-hexenedioate decarboxylase